MSSTLGSDLYQEQEGENAKRQKRNDSKARFDGTNVIFWMAQRVRLNPKNDLKRLGIRVKSKRKNVIVDLVLTPYLTLFSCC